MTSEIREFIKSQGMLICPSCEGEGEIGYFCGHETTSHCYDCQGRGIIRSLKKQKHKKDCMICNGRKGGCGGCNFNANGWQEWESYEVL
jgi:tRNA-binding EMAP/Myf-like protein